ncbi:MAG TPA: class I SAM-dependent methyltransferase [Candidatus Binatia bacterium]|nr:class I SAM-dependent methyltransferase [Candidatus Binatia bacterium]
MNQIEYPLDGRLSQRHYYDEACDPEFEITRPHSCGRLYQFLLAHKFRTGLAVLGLELAGKTVLEVCCGSGMMAEELARHGARVTGIDFSPAAAARAQERARRYGFTARFLVADAEHLPFPNQSFDIVAVHDGLHHLDDPHQAIREMTRVAREAVLILEPAQAVLTQLAVRLGIAEEIEEAGNYVRRLVPQEVEHCLHQAGFGRVVWQRTLMYYPHEPFSWFKWFDHAPLFWLFRALFGGANLLLGQWGNKLALAGVRSRR